PPSAPRSAPRLSSTSTGSMSGCPATRGTASGRTRSARRRGTSRRRRAETSGVVRTTSPRKLVCATSSAGPPASFEAAGFIDQHVRDVVLDRVLELATRAHEPVPRRGERDLALALRAGEDLEQLLADGHGRLSSRSPVASIAAQVQRAGAPRSVKGFWGPVRCSGAARPALLRCPQTPSAKRERSRARPPSSPADVRPARPPLQQLRIGLQENARAHRVPRRRVEPRNVGAMARVQRRQGGGVEERSGPEQPADDRAVLLTGERGD